MPKMIAGWQEKIDLSQQITHFHANGVAYPRIPFGGEAVYMEFLGEPDYTHCGDCAALIGQLHVCHPHGSCDIEECPKCHEQLLSCDCEFDEEA